MKKVVTVFAVLSVVIALIATFFCLKKDDIAIFLFHNSILEYVEEFEGSSVQKGEYVLHTDVIEKGDMKSATFHITKQGETVFEANESWRVMDLKSIAFKEDSYDVLVESGDVGTSEYIFNGETWILKESFGNLA